MNFFEHQDKARRATRWLVIVYTISTILIVAGITAVVGAALYTVGEVRGTINPSVLLATAVMSTALILGATLYKTARLSAGGGRVALDLGGTIISPDVKDPLRRRYRNVVEEIAIASGVPVPEIYVLEEEDGINAFAAGYTPGDAAIAVTRGCLELLDRNELQGVIAHEFSHILNGDMRLNIRMMGVLFGIMVVGIVGRLILRGSYHGSAFSSRRNKNVPVVMMVGLGLTILGWIGVFAAHLIKAAVSRQREFLADASAVQFTRQAEGIANALKKIGGYDGHSYITRSDPEEVSHMLFAGGGARLTSMFATHPPLIERIQALDPSFKASDYPTVTLRSRSRASESDQVAGVAGFAQASPLVDDPRETITDSVGRPEAHHILYAERLRSSIPPSLYEAAHSPDEALLLAIALALSEDEVQSASQMHAIQELIGAERADKIEQLYKAVVKSGPAYRLPLLEIAFPTLKNRPAPQIEFLLNLAQRLVQLDGRIELREYCYYRVLTSHLLQSINPAHASHGNRVSKKAAQRAAVDLVYIVATMGNDEAGKARLAFEAGTAQFGAWAANYDNTVASENMMQTLDDSLNILAEINSSGRQSLLRAISETITTDGKLTVAEAELLRTICAALHCPLPPILGDNAAISSD